jgi:hypothetical protein
MSKSVQAELFADSLCKVVWKAKLCDARLQPTQLPLQQGFRYQLCHVLWAGVAQIGDLVPATCA